jgi:hypothetical protein
MERASDVIEWLQSLPPDAEVWIDEGGLSLESDDSWFEIGGEPRPDCDETLN